MLNGGINVRRWLLPLVTVAGLFLILAAFVAVRAGWLTDAIVGLRSIWLLGMAAYMLSYLLYKRVLL